ncbi:hypothetical protein AURDEDRAFT_105248, partial [Auricularia subglabra TFB-10046 SS5]
MSAIVGHLPADLGIDLHVVVPADNEHVLDQYCSSLADLQAQLSTVRADKIGSLYIDPANPAGTIVGPLADSGLGPFDSPSAYYRAHLDRLEKEVLAAAPDETPAAREKTAFTFWLFRLLLSNSALESPQSGPFAMTHMDLVTYNTIVDETGTIVGVIDWDSAAFMPVELFATQAILFLDNLLSNHDDAKQKY